MSSKIFPPFPWGELLSWYEKNGRHHLPWRQYEMGDMKYEVGNIKYDSPSSSLIVHHSSFITHILYRVWLAEILLQQTQVDRVIPYFERILERYPTIHDLAHASYDEFFPYYQGMGYYSRARNILRTAKIVSEEYGGVFPRDKKLLQKLPGVGGYTSSAILAFGYGDPYLAWDTNLEKVFARYYNGRRDMKLTEEQKENIEEELKKFICANPPPEKGELEGVRQRGIHNNVTHPNLPLSGKEGNQKNFIRAINNALMDFAATVDLKNPENIDWENYPIHSGVWYETRGSLEPREEKKSITFPIPDAIVIVILHQDHKVYYSDEIGTMRYEISREELSKHLAGAISYLITYSLYLPFILPPALHRDTRQYVQEYFREKYGLELSVRPVHAKWITEDGQPYIAVNAQIQAGDDDQFSKHDKKSAQEVLKKMIP